MGNEEEQTQSTEGKTTIEKSQLKELQSLTKQSLSNSDIKKYYAQWHELYPEGDVNKEQFAKFASLALPKAPTDAAVEYLFSVMDKDKSGTIEFKEFLIYQSIMMPSSDVVDIEELIKLMFGMYDSDENGFVTEDELKNAFTLMYKAAGFTNTDSDECQLLISDRINKMFEMADKDGDRQLTLKEFLTGFKQDPSILTNFN